MSNIKTDARILKWIRMSIEAGVDLNTGDFVKGGIPEADNRHDGTCIQFEHQIQPGDILAALSK